MSIVLLGVACTSYTSYCFLMIGIFRESDRITILTLVIVGGNVVLDERILVSLLFFIVVVLVPRVLEVRYTLVIIMFSIILVSK